MKKPLTLIIVLVGLWVLAKVVGQKLPKIDWEKKFEQMPDDAPPKWMFRNISAIRENTDRILEQLEGASAISAPAAAPVG
jgi:hypothetical protein